MTSRFQSAGVQVAANVKCNGTGPALLSCLRAVNSTVMFKADHGLTKGFQEWSPVIDGVMLLVCDGGGVTALLLVG